MLRLSELRVDLDHTDEDLEQAVLRCLRVPRERLISQHLVTVSYTHLTLPTIVDV